jgi:hypothetical protein
MKGLVPSGDLASSGVSDPQGSLAEVRKTKVDWVDSVDSILPAKPSACRSAPRTSQPVDSIACTGGRSKLRTGPSRDRRLYLAPKKSKLNTESPPRGAVKSLSPVFGVDRPRSHAENFFPGPELFGGQRNRETKQTGHFCSAARSDPPIYFPSPRGGSQNPGRREGRTGRLATQTIPRISGNIFSAPAPGARSEISSRNSGGGGG